MSAKIETEKLPPFGGLFSRIFIYAVLSAVVVLGIVTAFYSAYLEAASARQAEQRLERSIAVLAPIIDGATSRGDAKTARQILLNLVEEEGVVCVDYKASPDMAGGLPVVIRLPQGGCANFNEPDTQFIDVSLKSSSKGAYRFYIDKRIFASGHYEELLRIAFASFSALLLVFVLLAIVFRRLVLSPLDNLQQAMIASRPAKPALADIFRKDEIGAVSRTYNKLAAASRIYFARLEKSQNSLRQSESKFKDMAEISGDWFYEMDADLRFTYISDRFFELTQIDPDLVIGKTRDEISGDKLHDKSWKAHLGDLAAHRAFKNFEYRLELQGAEAMVLRINGKPLFDETGTFIGYRGTGTDVTDITRDRQLLEETNRNFGDSVTYAANIQRGLLPDGERLQSLFGQAHLLWQPKDVVGGDFYWLGEIGGARYLVFFDCTGHGVPGALMTVITVSVLEKIAAASPVALSPAQMLEQMHQGVCAKLGIKKDEQGKDGLDCAVIKLVPSEGQLEFAGASIDLFVVQDDGAVTRLRGARHSLGYRHYETPRSFEKHSCQLRGHSFVLMTDGLTTQIGAQTKRVLGTRRVMEALETAKTPQPAQLLRSLGLALKRWQGSEERRDDVTLLAFRPYE